MMWSPAAETKEASLAALAEFEKKWYERDTMVPEAWRSNWERVWQFFTFARKVLRIIYTTTDAIESLNFSLREEGGGLSPFFSPAIMAGPRPC